MAHTGPPGRQLTRTLLDTLIRAGLITALVIACYGVFSPFLSLMCWALILAITLYPLHNLIKARTGHSDRRAATLLVLFAIAILLIPIYLLGTSLTESVQAVIAAVKSGGVPIPPPPDAVAQWPLIGKQLHGFWAQSASDLSGVLQRLAPQLKNMTLSLLGQIAEVGIGMLVFIAALMIAGIIMAYGKAGQRSAQRIATRVIEAPHGDALVELCTATIRAVAQGVIGIAFIQMLLIGAGFVFIGVPGAGLLALVVLLLGIMQLPATLITLPVIAFVFFTEGATLTTIIFAIYTFVAGLADNVLKPLLLGRGVDVPMPVVLIGALGGMVNGGIIGLFIGPVLLAVGYKLFWQWVDSPQINNATDPQDGE
ncbi:AI-2E family transporter [Pseudomonas sp.]|uniref:AI-2E family transporter n=1 Tax=Pseudomonas sp. TaxID=306 RepID=UPI002732D71B|nr:AI-2E family transporter [Pseudomonas sp.]MDP3814056.1 AI-2E family transporter [Pseudomonas sp.]